MIFNVKINNFNPQININLRVKTYSKTMPTRNYSRRKRQQKSQIIALTGLVTAAVALVLILAKLIFSGVTTLASDGSLDLSDANSYDVSEIATVSTSDAIIYTDDGSSSKISENTAITISAYYYDAMLNDEDTTLAQFSMNGDTYYIDTNDISLSRIILLMLISLKHSVIRMLILLMTLKVVLNKPLIRQMMASLLE